MERILIAGCGYVGTALATFLAQRGHEVWGLHRQRNPLPDPIHTVFADLTDPAALASIPRQLDYVAYTAGADESSDASYQATYVTGLRNLMDCLRLQGQDVKRFLFTSSTAVYAQSSGEWVDEESPTEPTHFTGLRLLEAEEQLAGGPCPHVIVRLGGIYGPGRAWLVEQVRHGHARLSLRFPNYLNLIHRDDVVGLLAHLMFLESPAPLYLGVDCEPVDRNTLLSWIAARLGLPTPELDKSTTKPPSRPRANKRCRNARLLATGYQFVYPTYREGLRPIIRSFFAPPETAG